MGVAHLIAFICFGLVAILSLLQGVVHFSRKEFMPYQADAIGSRWSDLDPRLQLLMLGNMYVSGGGYLATGLSIALMLWFPYRSGESWAALAITGVGLLMTIPTFYSSYQVSKHTPGKPPVAILGAEVVLVLLGFVLSFFR